MYEVYFPSLMRKAIIRQEGLLVNKQEDFLEQGESLIPAMVLKSAEMSNVFLYMHDLHIYFDRSRMIT